MSTAHQQYPPYNQSDKIREYAKNRGIETIKTYVDDDKSGLAISGGTSLHYLISDIETSAANFNIILVYDVSRCGRLHKADENGPATELCRSFYRVLYAKGERRRERT